MERTASGLWLPHSFSVLRMRAKERTVTLRDGQRAKVTVDDSGTVTQIETNEALDAVVRPKTVKVFAPRLAGREDEVAELLVSRRIPPLGARTCP